MALTTLKERLDYRKNYSIATTIKLNQKLESILIKNRAKLSLNALLLEWVIIEGGSETELLYVRSPSQTQILASSFHSHTRTRVADHMEYLRCFIDDNARDFTFRLAT